MPSKIEIYCMDCMDYMCKTADNFFDLAIVDPPYGINADKKHQNFVNIKRKIQSTDYGNVLWDEKIPDDLYFKQLKRISKHQIIFGANYFGLKGGMIYWCKNNTIPNLSDGELAYCSKINSIKQVNYIWSGMRQQNMKNKEKRIHPTQKPVALYRWILNNFANKGDKIFDSHCGSCSLAIACYDKCLDFTGTELSKYYYDKAIERIENHKQQLILFNI